MTDHRTLKKLVRERMARTGERYTTAHRQVTAHGAAAQVSSADLSGAVAGHPDPGPTQHAPSALARMLLAQVGVAVSEPVACGLGGGIGFLYAVFEYREVAVPLLTVVAQHHPEPWLDAVTRHLGLPTSTVTSSRPGAALGKLDQALEAGRPAQVVVASGLLPWNEPDRPEEAADPCAVVVAGRVEGGYLVDDGGGAPHLVDRDVLAAAWAAHRKGRFAVTTVDRPAAATDVGAGVRAALATTHAHLTGPVLGHGFDANMGLRGIRRLADDLADTRTKRGWSRRFGEPAAFAAVTSRLAECLTTAHTAPGGTRPLYATFLAEAAELTGLDLLPASRTAAEAGARWVEVADVAGAAGPDDDAGSVIAALAEMVAAIVPLEQRLADQLGVSTSSR